MNLVNGPRVNYDTEPPSEMLSLGTHVSSAESSSPCLCYLSCSH